MKEGLTPVDGGVVGTEDALRRTLEYRPDVVLVDIDAVGAEWRLLVRELVRERDHPAVVTLAWSSDPSTILDAVASGAEGYSTKDVTGPALGRALAGIEHGELAMSRKVAAIALRGMSSARQPTLDVDPDDPAFKRLTRRDARSCACSPPT